MKTTRNKKVQKMNVIILSSILVVLLAGAAFAYTSWLRPSANSQQTDTQTNPDGSSHIDLGPPVEGEESDSPSKSPPQYEGVNPNAAPSLTGFISYSSVVDGTLMIRVTIDQAVNTGTCTLTLTKAGVESVTKSSTMVANPSSSTCSGFDIPTSQLSNGAWAIKVTLTSESKTGTITGETTI